MLNHRSVAYVRGIDKKMRLSYHLRPEITRKNSYVEECKIIQSSVRQHRILQVSTDLSNDLLAPEITQVNDIL